MRTSNTFAGLFLILVAGAMIYLTLSFPPFPGQQYGPSLFPRILGSGLILCGLLLILRDITSGARAPVLVRDGWTTQPWRLVSFLLIPATIIVHVTAAAAARRCGATPLASSASADVPPAPTPAPISA